METAERPRRRRRRRQGSRGAAAGAARSGSGAGVRRVGVSGDVGSGRGTPAAPWRPASGGTATSRGRCSGRVPRRPAPSAHKGSWRPQHGPGILGSSET